MLAKVPGLGNIDDVVDAAEGYATNYLFPQHLAVLASSKALNDLAKQRSKKVKEAERILKEEQALASRLDGLPVSILEKTNEAGFFYAAIGPQKISEALSKLGFSIDKSQITVTPIKEPGDYEIKIKLKHKLESVIHLTASAAISEKKK